MKSPDTLQSTDSYIIFYLRNNINLYPVNNAVPEIAFLRSMKLPAAMEGGNLKQVDFQFSVYYDSKAETGEGKIGCPHTVKCVMLLQKSRRKDE